MHELGIQRSFLVSFIIHLFLFLIFSLLVVTNPFQSKFEPLTINIQSETLSLSTGLGEDVGKSAKKVSPHLSERRTKPVEKTSVLEKTVPRKEMMNVSKANEKLKQNLKKVVSAENTVKELKRVENIKHKVKREIIPDIEKQINSEVSKEARGDKVKQELKQITGNIDKALEEIEQATPEESKRGAPSGDPLSDANWSVKPRRTLFFPDIQSKIPEKYKKKGLSYSITVRITFDKNGLATRVEIVSSSGDPKIDSIFNNELRKIRVESISESRVDEIAKTFKISLK